MRCACVTPEPTARRLGFSLTGRICLKKKTAHRAPAACCSSRQSTRRCCRRCICTLPTLRRRTLPAFAAASMVVNRRHRGAMCSVCVQRAARCACVAPEPTTRQLLYSLTGRACSKKKQKQHTHGAPASACCSNRHSTRRCRHRCCICTLPPLRRLTLPAFAAASHWHGLATWACLS